MSQCTPSTTVIKKEIIKQKYPIICLKHITSDGQNYIEWCEYSQNSLCIVLYCSP
jgi:hypothetical protein